MVWSGNGVTYTISIHALREEGDPVHSMKRYMVEKFLSTPSARRATAGLWPDAQLDRNISIHALREEGDFSVPFGDRPL